MTVKTSIEAPIPANDSGRETVLAVDGLKTVLRVDGGTITVVDGVSFEVAAGETLAIVGESGSGKSMMALSLMQLVPDPPGRIAEGVVRFQGQDLLEFDDVRMTAFRGAQMAMIFQDAMTSLNPVLSIRRQLTETIKTHLHLDDREAQARAVEMLRRVQISEPERRLQQYPHQMSGGMLQRVMIAMALSCNPRVLIADEPTTALDVTIQAQILDLLAHLQEDFGMAIVLITHDLGVVAEVADRVLVMYAGRKVEEAPVIELFENPRHPYTRGLLNAQPGVVDGRVGGPRRRLADIAGMVPAFNNLPAGCHFAPRCPLAIERCHREYPPYERKGPTHWTACWEPEKVAEEM